MRSTSTRKTMWTMAELEPTIPSPLANMAQWKITASHNETAVANLTAGTGRWDTGAPQQPGMWLQIELPQAVSITEIQIDSTAPGARAGGAGGPAAVPAGTGAPGVAPVQPLPAAPATAAGARQLPHLALLRRRDVQVVEDGSAAHQWADR